MVYVAYVTHTHVLNFILQISRLDRLVKKDAEEVAIPKDGLREEEKSLLFSLLDKFILCNITDADIGARIFILTLRM